MRLKGQSAASELGSAVAVALLRRRRLLSGCCILGRLLLLLLSRSGRAVAAVAANGLRGGAIPGSGGGRGGAVTGSAGGRRCGRLGVPAVSLLLGRTRLLLGIVSRVVLRGRTRHGLRDRQRGRSRFTCGVGRAHSAHQLAPAQTEQGQGIACQQRTGIMAAERTWPVAACTGGCAAG